MKNENLSLITGITICVYLLGISFILIHIKEQVDFNHFILTKRHGVMLEQAAKDREDIKQQIIKLEEREKTK